MNAKVVIYIVAAAVITVLVVANWGLLIGAVELNLLITRVQAPLALLLLLFGGIILLLDLSVHAVREYGWRRERRELASALNAARLLAEKEEESRTSALKVAIQGELAAMRAQLDRVVAMQASALQGAATAIPPDAGAIEPELIPPREPRSRSSY